MQAEEPLLPREDVIAYAASKRKEDAPLTATDRHHHPHLLVGDSVSRRQGWVPLHPDLLLFTSS